MPKIIILRGNSASGITKDINPNSIVEMIYRDTSD